MRKLIFALPILLGVGISGASAQQPACTKRSDIISHLAQKYSETPAAIGLANNGGVLEVLVAPKGKSWTIIITMPNGIACMVAAGENWETLPEAIKILPGDNS